MSGGVACHKATARAGCAPLQIQESGRVMRIMLREASLVMKASHGSSMEAQRRRVQSGPS